MKRFIKIGLQDKTNIKMINQSENGFELVVISDNTSNNLNRLIKSCKENNDDICIVWQMKFKIGNYILYKNCIFSDPVDNYFTDYKKVSKLLGKKYSVKCSGTMYYSDSYLYKNRIVKKSQHTYKDSTLLERMLKIGELDVKSREYEL